MGVMRAIFARVMNKLLRNIFLFAIMLITKISFGAGNFVVSVTDSVKKDSLAIIEDTISISQDTLLQIAEITKTDSIIDFAKTFIGTPYKYGSVAVSSFDCSGYISYVFTKFGLELPHCSSCMSSLGETISLDEVQKGDLLFFKGRNSSSSKVGHVSLVVGVDEDSIMMIHASSRGVVVDDFNEMDYYQKRFVTAKRLSEGE